MEQNNHLKETVTHSVATSHNVDVGDLYTYTKKVRAIQFEEDEEPIDFFKRAIGIIPECGLIYKKTPNVIQPTSEVTLYSYHVFLDKHVIYKGDYLVEDGEEYSVLSKEEFEKKYEPTKILLTMTEGSGGGKYER